MSKRFAASTSRIEISNILSDPFSLATLSIASIAWIIAFAGSIAAASDGIFPRFSWWAVVFELLLILFIFFLIACDNVDTYRLALMACLATATVYTTNSVNNLVYSSDSADAAAAAGYILLSMINIIWLFYFGSTDDSTPKAWVDGFSVNKYKNTSSRGTGQPLAPRGNTAPRTSDFEMHENPFSGNQNPYGGDRPVSVTSAANMGPPVGAGMDLSLGAREPELGTDTMATTGTTDTAGLPIQYSYRARALFAYEANPEDENEISFDKDEILEVSDIQGRWWQARRANGEVGICPSNYVELLQ